MYSSKYKLFADFVKYKNLHLKSEFKCQVSHSSLSEFMG